MPMIIATIAPMPICQMISADVLMNPAVALRLVGVLVGFVTFLGLRQWGKQRRRRQFLEGALPRAYLPSKT